MPVIQETVEIKAPAEAVFDLIVKVNDFALYTGLIKEIKLISGSTYRWTVRVHGIAVEWDATITDCERPKRFGWRSIRGIENRGTYDLQAIPDGTRVVFTMEYRLADPLIEAAVAPLVEPLIRRVGADILNAVKERLEHHRVAHDLPVL